MAHAPSAVDNLGLSAAEYPDSGGPPQAHGRLADDPFVHLYHELRSPLGLIATTASGAASECAEGSATREQLERISRVAERTLRVTETVLALAQRDAPGPAGAVFRPAEALAGLVGDLAGQSEHEFVLDVRPGAWGARLFGHFGHFEGMVQALLTNACDHGAPGESIVVVLERTGDTVTLTVDNRVAERPQHSGLGIGSYLARRLAGELGGTLTSAQTAGQHRARFAAVIAQRPDAGLDDCKDGDLSGRLSGYLC